MPNAPSRPDSGNLPVHHHILAVDAFEVDRFEHRFQEFGADAQLRSLRNHAVYDALPSAALQDRYVVVAFDESDLLGHPHPLADQFENFGVDLVDLAAQFPSTRPG